jgi:phage tail protein X
MKKLLLITGILFVGCVTNPLTGKKQIDPNVQNALIDVARSAVAGLAASASSPNWAAVAQGALQAVYSTQSVNAIHGAVVDTIGNTAYAAAVNTAVTSVISAAQNKGLNQQSAILIGATALDNALQATKAP